MITQIGVVAGSILNFLEENPSAVTVQQLQDNLKERSEVILMSLGWLVREKFISLQEENNDILVMLLVHKQEFVFSGHLCCGHSV